MSRYTLAPGDFPDIAEFKSKLMELDFTKFSSLKEKLIKDVDMVLGSDLPRLMEALPREVPSTPVVVNNAPLKFEMPVYQPPPQPPSRDSNTSFNFSKEVKKAPLKPTKSSMSHHDNPFGDDSTDNDYTNSDWILQSSVSKYESTFYGAATNNLVSGGAAKGILTASKLSSTTLRAIWDLSDIDRDGNLDLEEFVIAMVLVERCKAGHEVPTKLDDNMVPLSKRMMIL